MQRENLRRKTKLSWIVVRMNTDFILTAKQQSNQAGKTLFLRSFVVQYASTSNAAPSGSAAKKRKRHKGENLLRLLRLLAAMKSVNQNENGGTLCRLHHILKLRGGRLQRLRRFELGRNGGDGFEAWEGRRVGVPEIGDGNIPSLPALDRVIHPA